MVGSLGLIAMILAFLALVKVSLFLLLRWSTWLACIQAAAISMAIGMALQSMLGAFSVLHNFDMMVALPSFKWGLDPYLVLWSFSYVLFFIVDSVVLVAFRYQPVGRSLLTAFSASILLLVILWFPAYMILEPSPHWLKSLPDPMNVFVLAGFLITVVVCFPLAIIYPVVRASRCIALDNQEQGARWFAVLPLVLVFYAWTGLMVFMELIGAMLQ